MVFSSESNQQKYPFILPKLPFDKGSFGKYFSSETFDYHYGKHHASYVNNLNKLLENKVDLQDKTLEEIITVTSEKPDLTGIYNNAAQIWNHTFFWHSMIPTGIQPTEKLLKLINENFGNFDKFIEKFTNIAIAQFGSGWVWLIKTKDNKLEIIKTANADTPITKSVQPLFTCDVWEHAYYIDYRNQRQYYVEVFLKNMVNWKFAEQNFLR